MSWTSLTAPPDFPRAAIPVGTLIYLLSSDGSFQTYDTATDTYGAALTPPDAAFGGYDCGIYDSLNDAIVLFGSDTNTGAGMTLRYDIAGGSWSALTGEPFRTAFMQQFAIGLLGRSVIVAGGYDNGLPTDLVSFYDLDLDTWAAGTVMPGVLAACQGAWVTISGADTFVVCGGDDGAVTPTKYTYDDVTMIWTSGFTAGFDGDASGLPAVVATTGSELVLLGGNGSGASTAAWLHDAATDTWTVLADSPFDDQKSAALVAGRVYAFAFNAGTQAAAVLDPFPPVGITAELVAVGALSTTLATLQDTHSRSWIDSLIDPGAHSITVQNDDADWAAFAHGLLVNYYYKGTLAVTGICEKSTNQVIADLEARQNTTWTGRLSIALLERGLVYPTGGVGRFPIEEDRVFNWTSPEYDDSTWIAATAVTTVAGAQADWSNYIPAFNTFADGFADTTAEVLWSAEGTNHLADSGPRYSRQILTIPLEGVYLFYVVMDNLGEVYIDGQLLTTLGQTDGDGFTRATQASMQLSAGDHVVAIRTENLPLPPANVEDPAGWAWACYTSNASGAVGGLIDHSDSAKAIIEPNYPAVPPGMTPGMVIRLVVEEAQARGALTWLILDFDDALDTAGNAWTTDADISTKVGTDLLTFILRELASTYVDVWMPPGTTTLQAWALGTRPGLGSAVAFTYGTNVLELVYESEGPPITSFLERWANGWAEDGVAPAGDPIEQLLGVGGLTSWEEVTRVATEQLAIFGQIRSQVRLTPEPVGSDDAYLDYIVSDVVTIPQEDMTGTTDERVLSIEVSEDNDTGRVVAVPVLKDVLLGEIERAFLAAKKMINGTGLGRIRPAQPVVPVYVPRAFTHAASQDTRCENVSVADEFTVDATYPSTPCGVDTDDGTVDFSINGAGPCDSCVSFNAGWAGTVSGGIVALVFITCGPGNSAGHVVYEIPATWTGLPSVTPTVRGTLVGAADAQTLSFSEIEIDSATTGGNPRQFGVGFGNGVDFTTGIGFRYYYDGANWAADLVLNDPSVGAGLDTILASTSGLAALTGGDVLRFERTGADIAGKLNGVDVLTYTLSGGELTDPGASLVDACFHMATAADLAAAATTVTLYTDGDLAVRRFEAGTTLECS